MSPQFGLTERPLAVASIIMSNPLAGRVHRRKALKPRRRRFTKRSRIGAKTERERDYIEAAASYYKDFSMRFERE